MIFARFFILCEKVCEILIILCEIKIQIMENVSLRFIYDKNKRATSSKPTSLIVEVRQNGTNRAVYINTGIKLYPNQFSNKNGLVIKNHDKANMLMVKAKSIFNKVEAFAYSDECTSLQDVKNYNKTETYNKNVLDFMRRELRERNPTESVLEHHNILINALESYGKIRLFSDLTYKNIDRADNKRV
jgi:integrase/recombinase XerD